MTLTLAERFWMKVAPNPKTGCWHWVGGASTGPHGVRRYGTMTVARKTVSVHRFSWEMQNGKIPDGMHVLHRCDNPICVNPAHLFLGTPLDNAKDRDGKRRGRVPRLRLTPERVTELRELYATGEWPQVALATRFAISQANVSKIVRGKSWSGVSRPLHAKSAM